MIVGMAVEGLICLLMALPLALPLIAVGALLGTAAARIIENTRKGALITLMIGLIIPGLMGAEASHSDPPVLHSVVTTVEVDAPIETVWKNVVAFPEIADPPSGILNLGFAYPLNARIDGTGVGAVRYCNFNTGPFVEPITEWSEPTKLAFDVRSQPEPMTELSPYAELHTSHLEYIRSRRGQFRLYEKDGKTILEGTTFYTHDIAPDIYWKLFSDEIIHDIHLRVLNHIKKISEEK